jgi:hypothetical protein
MSLARTDSHISSQGTSPCSFKALSRSPRPYRPFSCKTHDTYLLPPSTKNSGPPGPKEPFQGAILGTELPLKPQTVRAPISSCTASHACDRDPVSTFAALIQAIPCAKIHGLILSWRKGQPQQAHPGYYLRPRNVILRLGSSPIRICV